MSTAEPGTDRLLVAELVGLLNEAEHSDGPGSTPDSRLDYLNRRAALLHRLVDAPGDESSPRTSRTAPKSYGLGPMPWRGSAETRRPHRASCSDAGTTKGAGQSVMRIYPNPRRRLA